MRLRKVVLLGLFTLASIERTLANGTETLGPPSIAIAAGTGVAAAGVGLASQPGTLTVVVPSGAIVKQVLLYWEGFMATGVVGDNTITVSKGLVTHQVTGTLIGGPTGHPDIFASTFRADITSLGLVTAGVNTLTLSGLTFTYVNDGAGVFVIFDDGTSQKQISIRDGSDLAFIGLSGDLQVTVPQTFNFAASTTDRTASLKMFFASVVGTASTGGPLRPSTIEVTSGEAKTVIINSLDSKDGEEWDTLTINVFIPAGASSLTVQAFSRDDLGTGALPASFDWLAAALVLEPVTGQIGDRVFCDLDRDFIQDPGEPGLANVMVILRKSGAIISHALTDPNGHYLFTGLEPGNYSVEVVQGTAPLSCNVPHCPMVIGPIVLVGGDSFLDADFCFVPPTPGQGCPAKFWKDNPQLWVGYTPSTLIGTVFVKATKQTCSAYGDLGTKKFSEALGWGTSTSKLRDAAKNLLREAVAALLNAAKLQGNYPATQAEIILLVNGTLMTCNQAALTQLANELKAANSAGSPLCQQGGNCTTDGRPNKLTFTYTGGSCAAAVNSQPIPNKYVCSESNGGLTGVSPVQIIVSSSSSLPTATSQKYFNGMVPIGGAFNVFSAPSSTFGANTFVFIYEGGVLKQSIQVHTSCSAPLIRGETFGGLRLDDYAIVP